MLASLPGSNGIFFRHHVGCGVLGGLPELSQPTWTSLLSPAHRRLETGHAGSICTMEMANAVNLVFFPSLATPLHAPTGEPVHQQASEYILCEGSWRGTKPTPSNTHLGSYFISPAKQSSESQEAGSERRG